MPTITTICSAFHVRSFRYSSSKSNWRLIVNSGGADIVSQLANPGEASRSVIGVPVTPIASARPFPAEGFARLYKFGTGVTSTFDLIPVNLNVDTALLNPSSIRIEMIGDDLLRPLHILLWGIDDAGSIVPLTVDSALPNLSTDPFEGPSSSPLTLVDSGDDATIFTEVYVYVSLAFNPNAPTKQPVSFRIERADGTILLSSGLEDFAQLEKYGDDRDAKIWRLDEMMPIRRVDALGPIVPKLRVDGPDNAMIGSVVAFGVNRGGDRPVVVPLVHHIPDEAGTNPWVGTSTSPAGREMVLPLCMPASRQ